MTKPWLIGEANPYGGDPKFALYPLPVNSAGGRLCRTIMRLEPRQYLHRFERFNLCPEKWSVPIARANAMRIRTGDNEITVLCGAKVTRAFFFEFEPFKVHVFPGEGREKRTFIILPHPSGLYRLWGEPRAFERAREALRLGGVVL